MTGVAQQTGLEELADSEVVLDSQEETSLVATSAEVHNIHFPSQIANVLSLCRVIVKHIFVCLLRPVRRNFKREAGLPFSCLLY